MLKIYFLASAMCRPESKRNNREKRRKTESITYYSLVLSVKSLEMCSREALTWQPTKHLILE